MTHFIIPRLHIFRATEEQEEASAAAADAVNVGSPIMMQDATFSYGLAGAATDKKKKKDKATAAAEKEAESATVPPLQLTNCTLSVDKGELVAVVGSLGSGM